MPEPRPLVVKWMSHPVYPELLEAKTPLPKPQLGSPAMRGDHGTSDTQHLSSAQTWAFKHWQWSPKVWSALEGRATWKRVTRVIWDAQGRGGRGPCCHLSVLPWGSTQKPSAVASGALVHNFLWLSFINRLNDGAFPSPGESGWGFWEEFNYNLERG